MSTLTVRLPPKTLSEWQSFCEARNQRPSTAIRQTIENQLAESFRPLQQSPRVGGEPKVRVAFWLTESEVEGIRLRSKIQGGTRAGWIIRVIRAALTRSPQFGIDEIEALNESSYQLMAIGRNINQIARRLNEGQSKQTVELATLEELGEQIKGHTDVVDRMLAASTDRWALS